MILTEIKRINQQGIIERALKECMKRNFFVQRILSVWIGILNIDSHITNQDKSGKPVKPLDGNYEFIYKTKAQKRGVHLSLYR